MDFLTTTRIIENSNTTDLRYHREIFMSLAISLITVENLT